MIGGNPAQIETLPGHPNCLSDPCFLLWHNDRHRIEFPAFLNRDYSSRLDVFAFYDVNVFVYAIGWDVDTSLVR